MCEKEREREREKEKKYFILNNSNVYSFVMLSYIKYIQIHLTYNINKYTTFSSLKHNNLERERERERETVKNHLGITV